MRRATRRSLELAIVPTIGLVVALVVAPSRAALSFRAWLLVVVAIALVSAIQAVRRAIPADDPLFLASRASHGARDEPFPSLAKLERAVSMATASGYDVHHRLRPAVREVATGLLLVRRGIDLDRQSDAARAVLGEPTWELVRAERERPHARLEPGLDVASIEQVVASLERI
jgi:hypothetical protein